jgi:phosphoserine phosphatase
MSNIYLLRHGETDWNREERLQGSLDVPINAVGIRQASQLARRLHNRRIGRIFTSPLVRARQTAAIISSRGSCFPLVQDDLREIDHGVWTGMSMKAIQYRYPGLLAVWRQEPDRLRLDRAERLQDAYTRTARFLPTLLESALDQDVLVVGHGVTNSLILCAVAGTAIKHVGKFAQPNGSMMVLRTHGRNIVSMEGLKDDFTR